MSNCDTIIQTREGKKTVLIKSVYFSDKNDKKTILEISCDQTKVKNVFIRNIELNNKYGRKKPFGPPKLMNEFDVSKIDINVIIKNIKNMLLSLIKQLNDDVLDIVEFYFESTFNYDIDITISLHEKFKYEELKGNGTYNIKIWI